VNERSRLWWIGGILAAVACAWLFYPVARQALRPPLVGALVAIEPQEGPGAGVATVGFVALAPDTPFLLRAVLVAGSEADRTYFTEAARLVVDGAEVPASRLQRWVGPETVRVLWFTVEGYRPLVRLAPGEGSERFRFAEFFRADWPREWTSVGSIEPQHDDHLSKRPGWEVRGFGTQRYQARIELYPDAKTQIPTARFSSPGPGDLPAAAASFPTVTVALPGPLAIPSTVFGLTAIEPPDGAAPELLGTLEELTRRRLAFWKVALLGEVLASRGLRVEDLAWRTVTLDGTEAWPATAPPPAGEGASAPGVPAGAAAEGALVRVGARVVLLFADRGAVAGALDGGDWCIDFEEGTRILPLEQVFVGEGSAEIAVPRAAAG
jgi:hypothetical protein